MNDDDLEGLKTALMNAAFDPGMWVEAVDRAAEWAGAKGGVLMPIRSRFPGVPVSAVLEENSRIYFRDQWHLHDERDKGIPQLARTGLFFDQDIMSPESIRKSAYYNDFLIKNSCLWSGVLGVHSEDEFFGLVLNRGVTDDPIRIATANA